MSDSTAAALAALNVTIKELIVTIRELNDILGREEMPDGRDYSNTRAPTR